MPATILEIFRQILLDEAESQRKLLKIFINLHIHIYVNQEF